MIFNNEILDSMNVKIENNSAITMYATRKNQTALDIIKGMINQSNVKTLIIQNEGYFQSNENVNAVENTDVEYALSTLLATNSTKIPCEYDLAIFINQLDRSHKNYVESEILPNIKIPHAMVYLGDRKSTVFYGNSDKDIVIGFEGGNGNFTVSSSKFIYNFKNFRIQKETEIFTLEEFGYGDILNKRLSGLKTVEINLCKSKIGKPKFPHNDVIFNGKSNRNKSNKISIRLFLDRDQIYTVLFDSNLDGTGKRISDLISMRYGDRDVIDDMILLESKSIRSIFKSIYGC